MITIIDKTKALNVVKKPFGDICFNSEHLKTTLEMCSLPTHDIFIKELCKQKVLNKMGKDLYQFTSEPVVWTKLNFAMADYLCASSDYPSF